MLAGMTAADVRAGIVHAAEVTGAATLEASEAARLQRALRTVDTYLAAGADIDSACEGLNTAIASLDRMPEDPATAPDRAILHLVIDIASAYLAL